MTLYLGVAKNADGSATKNTEYESGILRSVVF